MTSPLAPLPSPFARLSALCLALGLCLSALPSHAQPRGPSHPLTHAQKKHATPEARAARAALARPAAPELALTPAQQLIVDAREAHRAKDRARVATLASAAGANSLAIWPQYWDLAGRIWEIKASDFEAFAERWRGSYLEDRLRNDWLLETGRRRDWASFSAALPAFRMKDDREVSCYALLIEQQAGKEVSAAAMELWMAQKEADEGCALLISTLLASKKLTPADAWRKARLSASGGRERAAIQAANLASPSAGAELRDIFSRPGAWIDRFAKAPKPERAGRELLAIAIHQLATSSPEVAAAALSGRAEALLPPDLTAWAWQAVGLRLAMKLDPGAAERFQKASLTLARAKGAKELEAPEEALAWKARSALRQGQGNERWQQVAQAIGAMSPAEQKDPAWIYWKARALSAIAADSAESESMRALSRELYSSISTQMNFYGALAAEQLGAPIFMPAAPAPLTAAEREQAAKNPGLTRALELISIGLRSEGAREWNYSLLGMNDRELMAAAALACQKQVWDRCISASERTRFEIDLEQRFPTPFRQQISAGATLNGLDPAYVYGLIRQESRFLTDARSGVGAAGLMQVMPATAKWTAKKIGMPFGPEDIHNRDVNLRIGMSYLKLVLNSLNGSLPMAAAGYNAGPGRPRRWAESAPSIEPAAWAESIPLNETRDYVKKVMSNTLYYSARLKAPNLTLKERMGATIRPLGAATPSDAELP